MSYGPDIRNGVPIGLPSIVSLGLPPLVNPYPTLNLDFIENPQFDSRITFSRGSQATLFDSTGTLRYAKHNLLTRSDDFADAAWTKSASSITSNTTVAPDGTLTGDKLVEDLTNASHFTRQNHTSTVGFTYVSSVYLKAAERTSAVVIHFDGSLFYGVSVNLLTGVLSTPPADLSLADASATSTVVSVGNGWYRVTVTRPQVSTTTTQTRVALQNGSNGSYTGDGTSGVYIWGAQLNLANMEGGVTSSLTTYYPTTTAAYYAPRFDYNPSTLQPRGLLIEEQRTNSLTYSDDFANAAWTKDECSVTANAIVAPDGTLTGDIVIANTAALQHQVRQTITLAASTTYTISVYAKAGGENLIGIGVGGNVKPITTNFDLSTLTFSGDVSVGGTIVSKSFTQIGNGWNRISLVFTTDSSGTVPNIARISPRGFALTPGDGTSGVYIWGAQLEAGSFATSVIPTTTTALTRNADVASMTGTNFSSWYSASEGTLFAQSQRIGSTTAAGFPRVASANDNTANNEICVLWAQATSKLFGVCVTSGATQCDLGYTGQTQTSNYKTAFAYKANDFAFTANAQAVQTDTNGTLPTVDRFTIGNIAGGGFLNGHIARLSFYPQRLPNATLQALTA